MAEHRQKKNDYEEILFGDVYQTFSYSTGEA